MVKWIDLADLSGLRVSQIDESLHPVQDGKTLPNSLYAVTGCHPNSGALFNTTSMAALVDESNKYYFEQIVDNEPAFDFMFRNGRFHAAYPDPLKEAWMRRDERIKKSRQQTAADNFIRKITRIY